ncbi:hypothetical protein TRFO_08720 [Tritrichomonas foetus]|uniref:TmcB/TmcC TPR repeats domain-containing protein n=1 Tax=Tritrichomonas foetus TaxID=1144522 RepID=A0A1J4JMF6_9EUKA|nr:hypothetical protein TRFO_08720 [Tritrichomonas foetus]|eukprot:OHS98725.1 hypothetical protein TRFO_08720 [Tritrichomonas foetus]
MNSNAILKEAKQGIIPKSLFRIIIKHIQGFVILSRVNSLLPVFLYIAVFMVYFLQTTVSFFLVNKANIWDQESPTTQVIRYISFIWRFGATDNDFSTVSLSFVVITALSLFGHVIQISLILVFWKKHHVHTRFIWVASFNTEFLMPLVTLAIPPEIAKIIGIIITDRSKFTTLVEIFLSVYIILFFAYTIMTILTGSSALFEKGRCLFWSVIFGQNYVAILISIVSFLSRILEFLDGPLFYSVSGLCVVLFIAMMIIEFYFIPIVDTFYQSLHFSFALATIILIVIQDLMNSTLSFSNTALVIAFFAIGAIFSLIFYAMLSSYERSVLKQISLLSEAKITFDECFTNSIIFTKMIRIGFKYGHSYVLSWIPFSEALERYNNSEIVWSTYVRFLSVYYEENSKLAVAIDQFKMKKFRSVQLSCFITQMKIISKSRNRHMSKDICQTIKIIESAVTKSKSLIVSYWSAIADYSMTSAYNIGSKLKESLEYCQSAYFHLISFFPNNPTICFKYAKFQENIFHDPQEALHWYRRSEYLNKSKSFLIDIAQSHAQKLFPSLPESIYSFVNDNEEEEESMSLQYKELEITTGAGSEASYKNKSEHVTNYVQSLYRNYGKETPIRVASFLKFLVLLIFILSFLCGQFLIPIIMQNGSSKFNRFYNGVILISNLKFRLEVIGFGMTRIALYADGHILDDVDRQDIVQGIEEFYENTMNLLNGLILETNAGLEELAALFITNSQHYFVNTLQAYVEMISPEVVNQERYENTYTALFQEAVNGISYNLHKYGQNLTYNFLNETWMISYLLNVDEIANALRLSAEKLRNDMNNVLTDYYNIVFNISIFIVIVTILAEPFFLYFTFRLKTIWKFIVDAISSLPRICLHKVIHQYSSLKNSDDEICQKEEVKFIHQFMQIQSVGDTHGGLPTTHISVIAVLSSVVAVGCIFLSLVLIDQQIPILTTFPNRYTLVTTYMTSLFTCGNLLHRLAIVHAGYPFWKDTASWLIEKLDSTYELFENASYWLTSEMWNGYPSDILSSTKEISDYLLNIKTDWVDHDFIHDRFNDLPPMVQIEMLHSLLSLLQLEDESAVSKESKLLIFFNHEIISHIFPDHFVFLISSIADSLSSKLDSVVLQAYLIATGLFLLGTIISVYQLNKLSQVCDTIRFCISLLSMIESNYIENSTAIMNIFGGVFEGSLVSETENAMKLKCQEIAKEPIMIVDEKFIVLFSNNPMKTKYGYAMGSILKDDLAKHLLTFDSGHTFQYQNDTVQLFHSEENSIILIFHEATINDKRKQDFKGEQKKMFSIKEQIIPQNLHHKVNFESQNSMLFSNSIMLLAVEFLYFNDYEGVTASNLLMIYKQFWNKLTQLAKDNRDATIVKQFGMTHFICFNMTRQTSSTYEVGEDVINFIGEVYKYTASHNFKIRMGLVYNKLIYSGMRLHDATFNVYSKVINRAHMLCVKSTPGFLLLKPKVLEHLPNFVSQEVTDVQVIWKHMSPAWINSIDLQKISNEIG